MQKRVLLLGSMCWAARGVAHSASACETGMTATMRGRCTPSSTAFGGAKRMRKKSLRRHVEGRQRVHCIIALLLLWYCWWRRGRAERVLGPTPRSRIGTRACWTGSARRPSAMQSMRRRQLLQSQLQQRRRYHLQELQRMRRRVGRAPARSTGRSASPRPLQRSCARSTTRAAWSGCPPLCTHVVFVRERARGREGGRL